MNARARNATQEHELATGPRARAHNGIKEHVRVCERRMALCTRCCNTCILVVDTFVNHRASQTDRVSVPLLGLYSSRQYGTTLYTFLRGDTGVGL
jgi:choline kinase